MPLNDHSCQPHWITEPDGITVRVIPRVRQRGIGIIEILITVLLLSIGFLAAAKMQVQGMRFSQSAYMQSQAYFMVSDIMDRMRGNSAGVSGGHYDGKSTSASAANPECSINFCTDQQIAEQDLFEWSSNLHPLLGFTDFIPLLPGSDTVTARGEIVAQGGGVYLIRIAWNEKIGNNDSEQQLQLEFAP